MLGPTRRIKKTGEIAPYKNPEIIHAELILEGKRHVLFWNKFAVVKIRESDTHILHMYKYDMPEGEVFGRWYNTKFPKAALKAIGPDNILTVTLPDYEIEDDGYRTAKATFVIQLTSRAANFLRTVS